MSKRSFVAAVAVICVAAAMVGPASGQNFPSRPIRLLTTVAGASADFATRVAAQGLTEGLGQPAIVENRGGSTVIAAQMVINATPDGHTLYGATNSVWILPLMEKVPYDPIRDFAPVALTTTSPSVLAVHPSVAAHSLKELIALAKAVPGKLNIGSGVAGSTTYLSSTLFKELADVNIVSIPYTGAALALNATVAGEVQVIAISATSAMPLAKAGRLRALAVASAKPSALAPGVPTAAEAGLPGYESGVVNGVLAPARTPAATIHRLSQAIRDHLNKPETKERLFKSGMEAVTDGSPSEFAVRIKSETARWSKIVKKSEVLQ